MSDYKEYLEDLRGNLLFKVACCHPAPCKECIKVHKAARVIQTAINDNEKEEN